MVTTPTRGSGSSLGNGGPMDLATSDVDICNIVTYEVFIVILVEYLIYLG